MSTRTDLSATGSSQRWCPLTCNNSRYLFAAVVLALAAGCGNYSNEDLEFMNAMPSREDLSANLPARSALTQGTEAELSKQAHDVAKAFNGIMFDILGGVDFIRSFPPSDRGENSRTWGPFQNGPGDNNPDLQWLFTVHREAEPSTFTYKLQVQRKTDPPDAWVDFLDGMFTSRHGARRGEGSFTMQTDSVRAAGFPPEPGDGAKIKSIKVDYDTRDFPISVHMTIMTYPDLLDLTQTVTTTYEYGVQADGQGALRFSVTGD